MKGEFLIADLLATPWALRREVLASHMQILSRWFDRSGAAPPALCIADADRPNAFEARRRESNARVGAVGGGGIAVIPVVGTITQRAGMMTEWCGGTSTQQISAALAEALRDDAIGQILMEFDTPGGSVFGVAELCDEIRDANQTKPVIGLANSLSASAGYWMMSQCAEAYVTPGGEVGSIGVWMAHEDWSKALAESGVVTTMVSAGKFKVEGNPYEPLDDEARAFMQSRVDDYYGAFVKAVARGRGVGVQQVRDGMGQGRVLGAEQAKASGMVDDILPLVEVVRRMQRNARSATTRNTTQRGRSALAAARNELEILG
jgi:signal peptide peptidase SppA